MKRTKFKSYKTGRKMVQDFMFVLLQQDLVTDETVPFLIELFNNRETEDGYKLKFKVEDVYESGWKDHKVVLHWTKKKL